MNDFLKSPNAFPAFIVFFYTLTCIRYAFAREWGRVLYWVCATGITISATWLVGGSK